MKFYAITATLAFAAAASAQGYSNFTNCAAGSPDMTVESFSLTPYPLCIGKNICATAKGSLKTDIISGAKLSITGRYLGRLIYTDNQDFCGLMAAQGTPCPIPATVTSLTACVPLKNSAVANVPAADTILVTNGNGNTLFCQASSLYAVNC
ncbi:hypothetical protein BGX26_003416 [Mortierella sp. AD094]|nr:hypothetical protein BGX26_003416 [Mortierella sp. AD094]